MIKNVNDLLELGKSNAVEIIGQYVQLKRRGVNHIGLCPFHNEKTPSFTVSEKKGGFKCFGCGEAGDTVDFLIEYEKMTFPEALEKIAAMTGERVEYAAGNREKFLQDQREEKQYLDSLYVHLDIVGEFYKNKLPASEIAWASDIDTKEPTYYINVDGRSWHKETIKTFGITCASSGGLSFLVSNKKYNKAKFLELGLIKEGDNGEYDFFRNRILFPIHNHLNKLVGFAGRRMSADNDKSIPKYINSPGSMAFQKDQTLYGLQIARSYIKDVEEAVLVEGYTDVITLHDNGVKNAVATCGTAFTDGQAKLLSRYVRKLIIVRDGDEAGLTASMRDVEVALSAGMMPYICILPPGEDPDSFIRRLGKVSWDDYLEHHKEDGLIWRVMQDWDPENNFKKQDTYRLAAELILRLPSELLRNEYLNQLTNKKYLGAVTKQLKVAIQEKEENLLKTGKKKLNTKQQYDALHYGIFEQNNKYFLVKDIGAGTGTEISNFVIKPIMLIISREQKIRLLEVVNEFGHSFIADIESKTITDFARFSGFVEGMGNYLYNEWAKPQHHIKIKRKVYANTPVAYPIYTMGWHQKGFWTWGNGITTTDGKFNPVNQYGIVTIDEIKWFLPATSSIEGAFMSDDDEDELQDQKNFVFQTNVNPISMKYWSQLMIDVHGKNAMIAIAYYMSALFRDLIYPRMKCFPHLNGFGPQGAGKSFLSWSLVHLFGATAKDSFHLGHGTDAAFFRTLSWARNIIVWFDEYKNTIDFNRVEALKKAYDGGGREKAKGGYGHAMTRSKVNSALILTGQEQPVQDIALFERCISLSFPKREFSKKEIETADQLKTIQDSGALTHITSRLQVYREKIAQKFIHEYDFIRSSFRSMLHKENIIINDRIVQNYCIPLTVAALIMPEEELAFTFEELMEYTYDKMVKHLDAINNQDDVGVFWGIVDLLLTEQDIEHAEDIIVDMKTSEKVMDDNDRNERKDSKELIYESEKKLVYVNFSRIHPKYQEQHQKQKRNPGLDLEALKYYLRSSEAYVGQKHGKKFRGKSRQCYVFDANKVGIPLDLTFTVIGGRSQQSTNDLFS